MRILAVSDRVAESLYTHKRPLPNQSIEAIVSCGDLPFEYLDYLTSSLNLPLFYVRGNHQNFIETPKGKQRTQIIGTDLHLRLLRCKNLTLAGIEGSIRYNKGSYQYSQSEMWLHAIRLIPSLIVNKLRFGDFLDIFVTHAPPWGINDQPDPAHHGAKAFRWFDRTFKPRFHLHGHIHLYKPSIPSQQQFHQTHVINTYGHHLIEVS